jgi:hypothetical protein
VRDFLSDETALTRAELTEKLGAEDIPVQGQALYHLLYRVGATPLSADAPGATNTAVVAAGSKRAAIAFTTTHGVK